MYKQCLDLKTSRGVLLSLNCTGTEVYQLVNLVLLEQVSKTRGKSYQTSVSKSTLWFRWSYSIVAITLLMTAYLVRDRRSCFQSVHTGGGGGGGGGVTPSPSHNTSTDIMSFPAGTPVTGSRSGQGGCPMKGCPPPWPGQDRGYPQPGQDVGAAL